MPEEYPEHVKLRAIGSESQAIGGFLEWLNEKGITLCTSDHNDDYYYCGITTEKFLARYFEIDTEVLEEEKQQMLKKLRVDFLW